MTTLTIHYYGMIAECTACEQEVLPTEEAISVNELDRLLKQKHPQLEKMSYKVAIGQSFVPNNTLIEAGQEIAVFPPFAGG